MRPRSVIALRQEGNVIAGAGHSWFGKVVNLNTAFLMEWISRAFVDNTALLTEGDPYRTSFYKHCPLDGG